jgi:hypothetical protein
MLKLALDQQHLGFDDGRSATTYHRGRSASSVNPRGFFGNIGESEEADWNHYELIHQIPVASFLRNSTTASISLQEDEKQKNEASQQYIQQARVPSYHNGHHIRGHSRHTHTYRDWIGPAKPPDACQRTLVSGCLRSDYAKGQPVSGDGEYDARRNHDRDRGSNDGIRRRMDLRPNGQANEHR